MAQGLVDTELMLEFTLPGEHLYGRYRRLIVACAVALVLIVALTTSAMFLAGLLPDAQPRAVREQQTLDIVLQPPPISKQNPIVEPVAEADAIPAEPLAPAKSQETSDPTPLPAQENQPKTVNAETPPAPATPDRTEWLGHLESVEQWMPQTNPYRSLNGVPAGLAAAKERYAPVQSRERPIWENVETDQLGRKILRAGDCYRVIEDNNAMRIDIFETFTRHLVFCEK